MDVDGTRDQPLGEDKSSEVLSVGISPWGNGIVPPHTKLLSAVFPGTAEVHGVVELRTSKGRFWGWETLIYGMRDGGMC